MLPEHDTAGRGRQIPAPPNTTTCSAQPRSHTPAPMTAPGVNLSLPNTLQVTAHSIPDLTHTTSMYQTLSATASQCTPNMPNARHRLTYDGTPQPLPYGNYAMYMPYGLHVAHYYGRNSMPPRSLPQYNPQTGYPTSNHLNAIQIAQQHTSCNAQNQGNLPLQYQSQFPQQPMPPNSNVSNQLPVLQQPPAQPQSAHTPPTTNTPNNAANDLSSIVA